MVLPIRTGFHRFGPTTTPAGRVVIAAARRSAHSPCTGPCEPSLGFCLRVMSWPQSEHVPTVAVTHAWHPRRSCQSIPQEVVRVITASQLRAAAAELLEEGLHRHPSVLWHVREVNLFDLRGVRLRSGQPLAGPERSVARCSQLRLTRADAARIGRAAGPPYRRSPQTSRGKADGRAARIDPAVGRTTPGSGCHCAVRFRSPGATGPPGCSCRIP